jgi:hypothetical protein
MFTIAIKHSRDIARDKEMAVVSPVAPNSLVENDRQFPSLSYKNSSKNFCFQISFSNFSSDN